MNVRVGAGDSLKFPAMTDVRWYFKVRLKDEYRYLNLRTGRSAASPLSRNLPVLNLVPGRIPETVATLSRTTKFSTRTVLVHTSNPWTRRLI